MTLQNRITLFRVLASLNAFFTVFGTITILTILFAGDISATPSVIPVALNALMWMLCASSLEKLQQEAKRQKQEGTKNDDNAS